jgi:hypothetical protein
MKRDEIGIPEIAWIAHGAVMLAWGLALLAAVVYLAVEALKWLT